MFQELGAAIIDQREGEHSWEEMRRVVKTWAERK